MNSLPHSLIHIQKELKAVASLIEKATYTHNEQIRLAIQSLQGAGGKMLRPAYFLLFSKLGDPSKQDQSKIMTLAASIELLHMATLIHDDIIDDSPLRRGSKTIQAQYGKDVAVYTGDLLFTIFFDLLAECIPDSPFLRKNAATMKRLLIGELDQMTNRYNPELTVEDYFHTIQGKTAELFSLSCQEGAHFGGSQPYVEDLAKKIGSHIGLSFQILDDILDYSISSEQFKKPVLEDIQQGVYSLPLILALKNEPSIFAPLLKKKQKISAEESILIMNYVHQYDGVKEAKLIAKSYTEQAIQELYLLPESVERDHIITLTTDLLNRCY